MTFPMPNKVSFISLLKCELPIYLDKDILDFLNEKNKIPQVNLQTLVNDLLRKDIEISQDDQSS